MAVALGDHRDADRGPLPLVLVVDLGDRDLEAVAQAVDDRAERGALRLQRPALRDVEVEADRGGVHAAIVAPRARDLRAWQIRSGAAQPTRCARSLEVVGLDDVALLEVLVVLEPDAALEARTAPRARRP